MHTSSAVDRQKYAKIKRYLDVFFAVVLLIACLPVFALIAIAIYLDDPGPVLYSQERAGRFHRHFMIYKFRSMKVSTPTLATAELDRLNFNPFTRLGRFLRRSSLDELPQLVNILKGDMSFVGPRPALPSQTFVLEGRRQDRVDALYPGLTGLAQVQGRDELEDQEKLRFDHEYLCRHSLSFDAQIILWTFKAVFTADGVR
jgi:O-antigen biosynthesis protein WbqP